jgi:hypothetical protein
VAPPRARTAPENGEEGTLVEDLKSTGENPVFDIAVPENILPAVSVDMERMDTPATPACIGVGPVWYTVGDLKEIVARMSRAVDIVAQHRSLKGFDS